MDLLQNPFYRLKATLHDNKKKIIELAEEKSLLSGDDKFRLMQEKLTHPHRRISIEVAWLPGIPPERVFDVLQLLESFKENCINIVERTSISPINSLTDALSRLPYGESSTVANEILGLLISSEKHVSRNGFLIEIGKFLGIDKLNPIARANLIAASMLRLPEYTSDIVAEWICGFAETFENIAPLDVCRILNKERQESGFPDIIDQADIVSAIQNNRLYYKQVIKSVLERINSAKERAHAVRMVIESVTDEDSVNLPILIEDLIDSYEDSATSILAEKKRKIEEWDRKLRIAAENELSELSFSQIVSKLNDTLKDWGVIAQPIQQKKRRQGLKYSLSQNVSERVRLLAIFLFNEYDKLDSSQQILRCLREVFREFSEINERVTTDLETLNRIAQQRESNSQPSLFDK